MNARTIGLRADASLDIGAGHVMRCLALADALRERGARCRFICRAYPGNLLDLIRERGHEARALPTTEKNTTNDDDAQQSLAALSDTSVDWLVVDHYSLDAGWERRLRAACRRLMVIDDLADRPHDCDLLLDQNLGRNSADYANLVSADCKIFVGPQYALLRPEFASLRSYSLARRASPQLEHLLISMGGVDKDNATVKVLDALKDSPLPANCRITVVMGPHAPWLVQVQAKAAQMRWATEVLVSVQNMAKLMADSDFAIGAAGTTAWERCCLGLPALTIVLANNQEHGARALHVAGAVLLIDDQNEVESGLMANVPLFQRPELLQEMQRACCSITDGTGAFQLAEELTHAQY